jgi:hypothetical protein
MLVLENEMCAALGLTAGSTTDQLFENLGLREDNPLDGLLESEFAREAAARSLTELPGYELRVIPQTGVIQERFCTINISGFSKPVLVGMLSDNPETQLPTALENLVFWAVIGPLQAHWRAEPTGKISDWRAECRNKAIVAIPIGFAPPMLRTLCALFGLQHADIGSQGIVPPLVPSAATLNITAAIEFTSIQARLLSEAASVQHPKWRCLSLYRILEHAYLENIKKILMAEFDSDATKAIDDARNRLGSEVSQLISLAEEANLKPEFLAFDEEFDQQYTLGNHFVIALDRSAKSEPLYKSREKYKKAVQRFYKLRCSIAHAGTSSVIYEQFQDADQGVSNLLKTIEAIALKSLRITAP